jgi:hypothetical protein
MSAVINQPTLSDSSIPVEKKKRGRKKQNVVLNVGEEPIVEIVKPPPKKRGRKPKGGKIIQQTLVVNEKSDNEPSVILHLKCSLNDIIHHDNYSTKYKYNPSIESIQSFDFDNNSNMDNFLIQPTINDANENNDNYIGHDELGHNDTGFNANGFNETIIHNNMDAANPIYDSNIESSNIKQDIANYCINNSNLNNSIELENNSYSKKHISNKNETWEKLNTLKNHLHHNNIYDKRSACFWCTYDFDNPPIFVPKHEFKNSYQVYGCFCSPECGVAYLMNEKIDSSIKFERYQLMNHIYGKVCNYNKNIKPAPNPYYLLDKFYGTLTIKEYRDLFKTDQLLIVVEKPLTHIFPELYEDNADFILNQRTIPSNTIFNLKKKGTTNKKTSVYGTMLSKQV